MDIYTDASVKCGVVGIGIYTETTSHKYRLDGHMKNTDAEKFAILMAYRHYGTQHTYYTDCIITAIQARKYLGIQINWIPRKYNKADKVAKYARFTNCQQTVTKEDRQEIMMEVNNICKV